MTEKSEPTLEDFYQWAKKIGHWRITEAIERYRKLKPKEKSGEPLKRKA